MLALVHCAQRQMSARSLTDHFQLDYRVDGSRLFEVHSASILARVLHLDRINLQKSGHVVLIEVDALYHSVC